MQSTYIAGQEVVLDDAPIFGPVDVDDGVVVIVQELGPVRGFSAAEVWGCLVSDHLCWHA
ncbi:hypothetical protein AQI70_30230 [Streptomyces curacoi]|uniref:Uncharacterized protein n=1 Tax=Streptomyces curacoi TaxID=146536 RepID=A0A124GWH6_9ACTN|nr:hypothetical protein AQI70_30230 [Streptomyces curacoi]